ncbi:hypothetical protein D187_004130 [Cystobacter fuscus DSM 2262]|uniref:Uncharacterized protein n=1 Tax=Cystobacter fuscus (strain ATCC 25194 / DSM 2262 / NBRC 100088 / M29) TaxID=1242864 RepID=S9QAL0_CYSF2|nr:hypothetical protein D187_004130 [Cystobacter fuscus DSM 2262]
MSGGGDLRQGTRHEASVPCRAGFVTPLVGATKPDARPTGRAFRR